MNRKLLLGTLLLGAVALVPLASRAGDHEEEEGERHEGRNRASAAMRASPEWKLYASECGSCHMAYPPELLPARSWDALLGGLDDHFGQNAELDEATRAKLADFLRKGSADAGAGRRASRATPPLRITELPWWRHEHDELSPRVYQRKSVGSPANCPACHRGAEQGAFDEDDVRIPRAPPAGAKLPADANPAR